MILDELKTAVTNASTITASAQVLISGLIARLQEAVDVSVANGATKEQLEPVIAEVDALNTSCDELASAIVANT